MKVYRDQRYMKDGTKGERGNCIGYVKIMIKADCILKLNKWADTYIDGWKESTDSIVFGTEDIATKTTMGYYTNKTFYSENGTRRAHYIVLDTKLFTYPDFLIESVLWHEFCHLWNYWDNGDTVSDHGKEFKNRQKTVLRYWLGDYIIKFCWGLS